MVPPNSKIFIPDDRFEQSGKLIEASRPEGRCLQKSEPVLNIKFDY
jgi:hypothetical protein